MNPAISKRLLPYVAMLLFVLFKIPHLRYAFYWDESWVYAPAVKWMYTSGINILPGAIPVDLSRGHPLFFHCVCAAWMNVFGSSNCAMHCFALFISMLLAIALFECAMRLFGWRVALVSLVLLLLNMDFFAASSFVLTDIMLSLFAFLTIYAYVMRRYLLTVLFLTLLVFTKESGIVACVIIGAHIFMSAATKTISLHVAVRRSVVVVAPVVLFLLFFAVQKYKYGWFLFPAHISAINPGIENTMFNVQRSLRAAFYCGHAYLYYVLIAALAALTAIQLKVRRYALVVVGLLLLYPAIAIFSYKDVYWYILIGVIVVALLLFIQNRMSYYTDTQELFLKLSVVFCAAYIYFCSINFFEERYLFPALLLLSALLPAVIVDFFMVKMGRPIFAYVFIAVASIGIYNAVYNGEALLPYKRMEVQQQLVDFMEENNFYDKHICCPAYIEALHLKDPFTGFLRSGKPFCNVVSDFDSFTELAIFDNMEPYGLDRVVSGDTSFIRLRHFEKGGAWIEVYAQKSKRMQ